MAATSFRRREKEAAQAPFSELAETSDAGASAIYVLRFGLSRGRPAKKTCAATTT